MTPALDIQPVTPQRWPDLVRLFEPNGACQGCWCMFWRTSRAAFHDRSGEENRAALQQLVLSGQQPGFLAYAGAVPVGWCSAGPRSQFAALERSRMLKRVDDLEVWSVVCFYIARSARRQGVMTALLRGVLDYAARQGVRVVEAYPTDLETPKLVGQKLTGSAGYMGVASVFQSLGFQDVKQVTETRRMMRCWIGAREPGAD